MHRPIASLILAILHFLRFYWPIVFALIFACLYRNRIKHKGEFFVFSTLVLFGISRLIAIDIGPRLIGLFIQSSDGKVTPETMGSVLRIASDMHIAGQIVAAVIGIFAVNWLARRYFEHSATDAKQRLHTRSTTPKDAPVEVDDNLEQFLHKRPDGESQ